PVYGPAVTGIDVAVFHQELLDSARIEQAGPRVDVREKRAGARMPDRVRGCHEGQRRRHDPVARADAEREVREKQGSGARMQRHGMLRTEVGSKVLLEASDLRSRARPALSKRIGDLGDLGLADVRFAEDDVVGFTHGFGASKGSGKMFPGGRGIRSGGRVLRYRRIASRYSRSCRERRVFGSWRRRVILRAATPIAVRGSGSFAKRT